MAPPAHPLAELPKLSPGLSDVRLKYNQEDTIKQVVPWFVDEFYNEEEWSLWRCDYKYNDELTLTFMSNNLISGFFARLEASFPYIFGTAVVYGESNNNGIRGVFVVRGKDYKPAFDVASDIDSFEFTKMDPKNAEDRATLEAVWDLQDTPVIVNGEPRKIAAGEVFK